jgi:hypothetical protein
MRNARDLCLAAVLAVAALATGGNPTAVMPPAQARWKLEFTNAPHRTWYAQQHDHAGWSCCDRADAHPVYDAYIRRGKWYVPIEGTHHQIPPERVLDGPNPTGHAVVWYSGAGDHVTIFCFVPGPLY